MRTQLQLINVVIVIVVIIIIIVVVIVVVVEKVTFQNTNMKLH